MFMVTSGSRSQSVEADRSFLKKKKKKKTNDLASKSLLIQDESCKIWHACRCQQPEMSLVLFLRWKRVSEGSKPRSLAPKRAQLGVLAM